MMGRSKDQLQSLGNILRRSVVLLSSQKMSVLGHLNKIELLFPKM